MKAYSSLAELESDLDYARKNPNDEAFFVRMVERYKNATMDVKRILKGALFDRMLEYNPSYLIKKVSQENPEKIIYKQSEQDPFFYV